MKLKYIIVGIILLLFILSSSSNFLDSNRIAVLEINGVIDNPKDYLKSIDNISKDSKIKGLIVRIDSPGGTVGSSQEIYESLKDIQKKIPVVASIIDVGASGGYLIACGAETIFANSGSITGSIGVISQYYDASKLLEFLKFNVEILKSGEYKDSGTPTRSLSENEKNLLNKLLKDIHQQFKSVVQKERGLTTEETELVSQGQIFSGEEAAELKLVDYIGGLSKAKDFILNKVGEGDMELDIFPKKEEKLIDKIIPETLKINSLEDKLLYAEQTKVKLETIYDRHVQNKDAEHLNDLRAGLEMLQLSIENLHANIESVRSQIKHIQQVDMLIVDGRRATKIKDGFNLIEIAKIMDIKVEDLLAINHLEDEIFLPNDYLIFLDEKESFSD